MVDEWSKKTSNPIEDISELVKVMRKSQKIVPPLFYYKGKRYTFDGLLKIINSKNG